MPHIGIGITVKARRKYELPKQHAMDSLTDPKIFSRCFTTTSKHRPSLRVSTKSLSPSWKTARDLLNGSIISVKNGKSRICISCYATISTTTQTHLQSTNSFANTTLLFQRKKWPKKGLI